jgi:hypothetical protein
MTWRDVASVLQNLNEECETPQRGTTWTPPARVPAVAEFRADLHLKSNDVRDERASSPALVRTELMVGKDRTVSGRYASHATGQAPSAGEFPMAGCCGSLPL